MKRFLKILTGGGFLLLLPAVAFAQVAPLPPPMIPPGSGGVPTLQQILVTIGEIIKLAAPLFAAMALLAFFYGLAMFLFNFSAKEEDMKKGRTFMLYGIIALFLIVSVFGIVAMLQATFGLNKNIQITPPEIINPYD